MTPDNMQSEIENQDGHLLAFLDLLISQRGPTATAEMLGVSYRTIARTLERRRLSRVIIRALEGAMLSDANPAVQQLAKEVADVRKSVGQLAERVEALATIPAQQDGAELRSFREENDKTVRLLGRRITALEKQVREDSAAEEDTKLSAKAFREPSSSTRRPSKKWYPPRVFPTLVTAKPAVDDHVVYGRAWPLVKEWRRLSKSHAHGGRTLAWLKRQERILELEVVMLDEHRLTLPPEDRPIDETLRTQTLAWRRDDLRTVRRRIVRRLIWRWVRRILTFGVWWG